MCPGCGVSSQDFFLIGGIASSVIITIFSIYQFILLSSDNEMTMLYLIIWPLIVSKLVAIKRIFYIFSKDGFIYYLLGYIFSCEWYFSCNSYEQALLSVIYQLLIITLPTNMVNIYLLSDTTKDISHGYYFAVIFINYILLGISMVAYISNNSHSFSYKKLIFSILSVFANFCFLYLFTQSILYNKFISISLLIFNMIVGVLDYCLISRSNLKGDRLYSLNVCILSYIFQINGYAFKVFTKSKSAQAYTLPEWKYLVKFIVQFLNLIVLTIIKLQCYPNIIKLDTAFYVFLILSIPVFLVLAINLYHKLTKQNKYTLELTLNEENLKIENKAYDLLQCRFVQEYKVNVKVDSFYAINKEESIQNLATLQQFMKNASNNQQHNIQFSIKHKNCPSIFSIDINYPKAEEYLYWDLKQQKITLQLYYKFFTDPKYLEDLRYLSLLLCSYEPQQIAVSGDSTIIQSYSKILIDIAGFGYNRYLINSNQKEEEIELKKALLNIVSSNYSVLLFQKNISTYLPINPQIILYDLYSNDI